MTVHGLYGRLNETLEKVALNIQRAACVSTDNNFKPMQATLLKMLASCKVSSGSNCAPSPTCTCRQRCYSY